MESELKQQLRVDDPMEEKKLLLDGLQINTIQVLLEPPAPFNPDADDEDDEFYSPLDHFQNLVKLSMTSSQCESLEGFPHLPKLQSLLLADNNLSSGFQALADADLQSLVRLDLSGNKISDVNVLRPLDALENLQHLSVAENKIVEQEHYRDAIFEVLPQLITVDGLDSDGTELNIDDDEALDSGDEEDPYEEGLEEREDEGEYQIDDGEVDQDDEDEEVTQLPPRHSAHREDESEDLGSDDENDHEEEEEEEEDNESQGSDSELEDQENRPVMGGKTTGGSSQVDDEEDDDELDEEDEEVGQQLHQRGSDDDEEDDEEDDGDDEEEDEHDEEDEEEEEEAPGLAYLLEDDIPDENDEEFEPVNDVDEESEMESSDEEDYGSRNATSRPAASASGGSNTNGHPKRPRSPTLGFDHSAVGLDNSQTGFDIDDAADAANGFGMASFDGPATFDDDAAHDTKRQRS